MKFFLTALLALTSISAFSAETMKNKMNNSMESAKMKMNQMGATQLDDLIRGEMAAIQTYDQVLVKVTDAKERATLTNIRTDHVNALAKLKSYATKDVKEDTESAGVWGAFAKSWTGGAKLFGNETALKALTQGEEHGVREYKEALDDKNVSPELKQAIRTELLPKQEGHITTIKTFI